YAGAKRITNFEEVKEASIDTAKYATRGEVAYQIATALGLDTSDPIVDGTQIKDVKPTHEYAGAIEATRKAGIFSGDAEGKFNPSSLITRAQAAKALTIAFGLQDQGEVKTFTDVPADHWAFSYVSTLANNEITKGKTNGSFGLNDNLTKDHLKLFIERSVK
ncbi:MAG TPA: S-layer homology domain-containing protein, partial [Metalysinibacillus sp.]